jgi:hypothetical protein
MRFTLWEGVNSATIPQPPRFALAARPWRLLKVTIGPQKHVKRGGRSGTALRPLAIRGPWFAHRPG